MRANPIYTPEHSVLVTLIESARGAAGISQRELGRRLRKSQSHICRIEKGQRRVDVHELLAISRALDLDPGKFFGLVGDRMACLSDGPPGDA